MQIFRIGVLNISKLRQQKLAYTERPIFGKALDFLLYKCRAISRHAFGDDEFTVRLKFFLYLQMLPRTAEQRNMALKSFPGHNRITAVGFEPQPRRLHMSSTRRS